MAQTLKAKTLKGLSWSFIGQLGNQVIRVGLTALLARLLSPEEFGVIAMITVFSGFGNVILNFGFAPAIIQHQSLSQSSLSSIFWLNTVMAMCLSGALMLCSPLIANFYDLDILQPLTVFMATTFLFSGLNVVQNALLSKELKFDVLVKQTLIATAISGAIACGLAYSGFGVWSLATQLVASPLLITVLVWNKSDWRPSWVFRAKDIKGVSKISGSLFLNSSLSYVANNVDNMIIGRMFGQTSLGLYSKSFAIISIPPNLLSRVLSAVMLPSFSKLQDQPEKIGRVYLDMTKIIAMTATPIMVLIALYTETFISVVFGDGWMGAKPYIQIFCVSGVIASINTLLGSVIISRGRSDLVVKEALIKRPVILIGILAGAWWGPLGIAFGKLSADVINLCVTFFQVRTALGLTLVQQIVIIAKPILYITISMVLAFTTFEYFRGNVSKYSTAVSILLTLATYAFSVFVFDRATVAMLYRLMRPVRS